MIYFASAIMFAASLGYAWLVRDSWREGDSVLAVIFAFILCVTLAGVILANLDAARLYMSPAL